MMSATNFCIVTVHILLFSAGLASSKTCWPSTWINNNHPTSTARNDVEPRPSTADLNAVCPQGLTTITAQCKDNKGEPFAGGKNVTCGPTGGYFISTCDVQNGLNCTPHGASCTCPDFSVRFGCECPTTPKDGATTHRPTTMPPGQGGNDASVKSANLVMHAVLFLIAFMF